MDRLPTLFVSHGAPSFALAPGLAGAQLAALAQQLPRPRAVLVVSPHWMTREPVVQTGAQPETVHDFGGFDPALYRVTYPSRGHPALAQRAIELLRAAGWSPKADEHRGLDHGAWVPLRHLYPRADVPVFQVSMPVSLHADTAVSFGEALAPLADEGVLIVGSGSLTHNLHEFRQGSAQPAAYAEEFAEWIRDAVQAGDRQRLLGALSDAPHAHRAHPSDDHFLPLLVAARDVLPATVLPGGIVHGVLSMESYLFGREVAISTAHAEVA
jgi:4,5-DOPA dioxygenase extradiol